MLIFLDDSGDPGFKVGKGSSRSFVIALVVFDDELEAEDTALKIKKLRRQLGLKDSFEFRFSKCRSEYRRRFLECVASSGFRVRAIIMDKERIYGQRLRSSKESFYNYTIKTLLKNHQGTISNAKLRLDGHGAREIRRELNVYLRRELGPGIIREAKFRDSHRDVLIQLADMVAGCIRLAHDSEDAKDKTYRSIIEARIENVWHFGWENDST